MFLLGCFLYAIDDFGNELFLFGINFGGDA